MAFLVFLFIVGGFVLYERSLAARGTSREVSDHFNGSIFFNPYITVQAERDRTKNKSVWLWLLFQRRGVWSKKVVEPVVPPSRVREGIRVTLVNHATVLVQCAGVNIITDPMWARRASPLPFIGPARYADPGIRFGDLPPIDIVLLSHNHYDHMDIGTLRRIHRAWKPRIYTGLGNAAYLAQKGIPGARDMDWWDRATDGDITVVSVPSRHFSARTFTDRNRTLWCGFVLETPGGNIYFAGDTGYGGFVAAIRSRYESFILGLVPIGAYAPAWMMQRVHVNPEEALKIHDELNIATSVGIHHGTFRLTDEPQDEPREHIESGREKRDFRVMENGGVYTRV